MIAAFALRERPSAAQVTGVGLGVLGLAVVGCGVPGVLGGHEGTGARVPLTALSLLVDGPAAIARGLTHLGWDGVLSTAYTAGLCSLVGYAVFNRLLSRYPSGHVVPWVLLAAVVAIAASWALLGQTPGPAELSGAVLLGIGVLTAQGTIRIPRSPRSARSLRSRGAGAGQAPERDLARAGEPR